MDQSTREKISAAGKNRDPKSVAGVAAKNTGKKRSIETRERMSAAKRGSTHSEARKKAAKYRNWDKNPAWKDANSIYARWVETGRPGYSKLQKEYEYTISGIQRAFAEGWVPSSDPTWIGYLQDHKKKNPGANPGPCCR
jgi:hypothetical protein